MGAGSELGAEATKGKTAEQMKAIEDAWSQASSTIDSTATAFRSALSTQSGKTIVDSLSNNLSETKRAGFQRTLGNLLLILVLSAAILVPPVLADGRIYPLEVQKEKHGPVEHVIVQNKGYAPVSGRVVMTFSSNVRSDALWPIDFKLPPRAQIRLATLWPAEENKRMAYVTSHDFVIGDSNAQVQLDYPYSLPLKIGTVFDVLEDGKTASPRHATLYLKHAFDFGVPTGKPIVAARPGVVIRVAESNISQSNESQPLLGKNWTYDSANSVAVLHNDGSIGLYMHILNDSAAVAVGESVVAGQLIAFAGKAEGHSSNYFHFAVLRQTGNGLVSVPVSFHENGGTRIPVVKGTRMQAGRVSDTAASVAYAKEPTQVAELLRSNAGWLPYMLLILVGLIVAVMRKPPRHSIRSESAVIHSDQNTGAMAKALPAMPNNENPTVTRELLADIEWRRFEELIAGLLRIRGYETKTQAFGPDGGVDIHLHRNGEFVGIAQCKHHAKRISVEALRSFLGTVPALKNNDIEKYYFSTSGFSRDARKEGDASNVQMVDGEQLIVEIKQLSADQQRALHEIATEGDYRTPTCAKCGAKMRLKDHKSAALTNWWLCSCGHSLNTSRKRIV